MAIKSCIGSLKVDTSCEYMVKEYWVMTEGVLTVKGIEQGDYREPRAWL